jgi:membrane associated rhomboid family serine protease
MMTYNRWHSSSGSQSPLTYIAGVPVDLTVLIIALHVVATIVCAVLIAAGQEVVLVKQLLFNTAEFWEGTIWTVLTDSFYHNIAQEHIWLALNLYFFYQFGREIERLIGCLSYGVLYLALMVVPPLTCLAAAAWLGTDLGSRIPYLSTPAHFAMFVGFAYVYPGVLFLFGLSARHLALLFILVISLALVASQNFVALIPFAASLLTVYLFLHFCGAGRSLGLLEVWDSWRAQKEERKMQKRWSAQQEKKREAEASVDSILEKISSEGLHSLTPKERLLLERKGKQLRANEGKAK